MILIFIGIIYSEVTISDRGITSIFAVLGSTFETRIFGVEVRHHCLQSIQLTLLTVNLRSVSIMKRGNRRDIFLEIGYSLLIASRGILSRLRVGVPGSPDRLEVRKP